MSAQVAPYNQAAPSRSGTSGVQRGIAALTIGALGVVFGDIGTSPLYALQAIFGPLGQHLAINTTNVYGIISLVIWAVTLVVSCKYIGFLMRLSNEGEGGIMALVALVKGGGVTGRHWPFILLGLVGMSFFYGDSAITPAISVLSAVEGLKVIEPSLASYVLPTALAILAVLFWLQKYGSSFIGRLFGPVMLVWFAALAMGGVWQIRQHPGVLQALSPLVAINFFALHPFIAFTAMGAVVLAITGAEALYADMGHFGRAPIARAWFLFVFPALLLCYMGQGALLLSDPAAAGSPFFLLYGEALRLPMVILATLATLIASQSVISGAFSLTHQAVQLDFLPRMMIRHTSARKIGQIYLPFINLALFVAVTALVLFFGSSGRLANAYGVAVSGTLAIDTVLFIVVMRGYKTRQAAAGLAAAAVFLVVDLLFVASNVPKIMTGGWFPIIIAGLVFLIVSTWTKGQRIVSQERRALEGPLQAFVDNVHAMKPPVTRLPGQAVYISHHAGLAPLALHAAVEELHELHEKVVIVSVEVTPAAHIPEDARASYDTLAYSDDGVSYLKLSYGFHDPINIPKTLASVRHLSPELDFDPETASYFISLSRVIPTKRHNLAGWRKSLYSMMSRNALSVSDYYKLPVERTIEMRSLIKL